MTARKYSSRAQQTTLSAPITSTATSMSVISGSAVMGGKTLTGTTTYTVVIDPDTALEEIVDVTVYASGNVLTIARGVDGPTPGTGVAHSAGAVVRHMAIGRDYQEANDHIKNETTAHGTTGAVVGTTNTQTLTNKTLTSPTITGTGAIAGTFTGNLTGNVTGTVSGSAGSVTNGVYTTDTGTVTSTMIANGTILNTDINASAAIDWTKLGISSTVSSTEIGYVDGVTSAIQTQLDSKQPTFAGYDSEIHVSGADGNDTTGNGDILAPVATITKALTLVTGSRRTVIVHPGTYTESPSITTQYTTLTGPGLIGGNIVIDGTVSTNTGCTITGLKMTNFTSSAASGSGNVNLLNCDVSGTFTKSGTGLYTFVRLTDFGAASITGSGLVDIYGGNTNFITVNNASANVLVKNGTTVAPVLTAGSLSLVQTVVIAAVTNAVTSAAGSVITIANSQLITSALTGVAPVVLNGFYSIFNTVFDKPTSTLAASSGTGGTTNAIDYFQYINADKFITQGGTSSQYVKGDGSLDSVAYAPLASPTLTGVPLAPTAAANTNTTQIATTAYVQTEIADLIAAAPGALDTLDELAAALGDDAAFSTTVTNSIAAKLPLAGGTMSGAIAMGTNKITGLGTPTVSTDAATKAYVDTMLPLAGGTMSGAIAMGTNKITGVGNPTNAQDAATKYYIDNVVLAPSNLTGPITSVGSATSIASQTGTGSTFVMNSSPTLVTPVLGVATATSINGTTIPSSKTLVATDSTAYVVPSQTGNSGKFLTTDGTTSSWGAVNVSAIDDNYILALMGAI